MLEKLTLNDFTPHLHTCFRVEGLDNYVLELAGIDDHSTAQLEQFSLIFTGPISPWLQQGSYKLIHPEMQECGLFLVPIGPDAMRMRYEAVFSRLITKPEAL